MHLFLFGLIAGAILTSAFFGLVLLELWLRLDEREYRRSKL